MEKFVVSKDLAERLKAAGYEQTTQFYWESPNVDEEHHKIVRRPMCFSEHNTAAPLSDELLAVLPARLDRRDRSSWNLTVWKTWKGVNGDVASYSVDYTEGMTDKMLVGKTFLEQDTLANAAATLWLLLHNLLPKTKE